MKTIYSFDTADGCIEFLQDLTKELDYKKFAVAVNECFPAEEAQGVIDTFRDDVFIPFGEMRQVAERANHFQTVTSHSEKVVERKSPSERKLSEKMKILFSSQSMFALSQKAKELQSRLNEKILDHSIETEAKGELLLAQTRALGKVSIELFTGAASLNIKEDGGIKSLYRRVRLLEHGLASPTPSHP